MFVLVQNIAPYISITKSDLPIKSRRFQKYQNFCCSGEASRPFRSSIYHRHIATAGTHCYQFYTFKHFHANMTSSGTERTRTKTSTVIFKSSLAEFKTCRDCKMWMNVYTSIALQFCTAVTQVHFILDNPL